MNRADIIRFAVITAIAATSAVGAEAVWQQDSVGKVGVATVLELVRIRADHCSVVNPQLKSDFDSLRASLTSRVLNIGDSLLLSDEFKDMKSQPVPAALVTVLNKEFAMVSLRFAKDAATNCPKELQKLRGMNDDKLKSEIASSFGVMRQILQTIDTSRSP